MEFLQTTRFARNYQRYNGERARIRQKITDIHNKFKSEPSSWLRTFERLRDEQFEIYRVKISEGDRLIFCIKSSQLIIVDVGPHDIMEEFLTLNSSAKEKIISSANLLPKWFFSKKESQSNAAQSLQLSNIGTDEMRWLYEDELSESWLQYLDHEQFQIRTNILEKIRIPGIFEFHLILGGAGTGKTVILLNLALSLSELGRNVVTRFSEQVKKYLNSGKQRVPGANLELQPGSVVLLDDPSEFSDLRRIIQECNRVGVRSLVVALDPFQWVERRVFEKFYELMDSLEPKVHELSLCYRQSANVGTRALLFTEQILDKTSPFILDSKIEEHRKSLNPLKEICVDKVKFVDSGGRFRIFETDLQKNFESEILRIRNRIDLWKHWHPLLLVDDPDGFELPKEWRNLSKGLNAITKSVHSSQQVRGCEYQEVILLLGSRTWHLITNGILGATSTDWQKAISFHTLMTRPKDSLSIFIKS